MAADRTQLEAWIAKTRRTQQLMIRALGPAAILALALLVVSRPIGGAACGIIGMFALFGYWITNGHIQDWEQQIEKLERPPARVVEGNRLRRERD